MQFNTATIIGAGGTGQHLIPALIRLLKFHPDGTSRVTVYDGDKFEEHNEARQIGSTGSKVAHLSTLLKQQGLEANCVDRYVSKTGFTKICKTNADNQEAMLVIAAVDNDATRKMCIDALLDHEGDFLFVTPGNSDVSKPGAEIKGNVLWFGRVGGTPIGISPAILFPNIETPQDGIPRTGGCVEAAVSNPQLIPANALAAAWTLVIIQNILDDCLSPELSHLFFNGRSLSMTAN